MHFVGKILVVLLLILSVLFMAFAGAVYNAHLNWRDEAGKQKKLVADRTKERDDTQAEMQRVKNEMDQKVNLADQNAANVDAVNRGLMATVAKLQKDNGELNVARKTAAEQAMIAEEEALARRDEAQNLRKINHDQALKL